MSIRRRLWLVLHGTKLYLRIRRGDFLTREEIVTDMLRLIRSNQAALELWQRLPQQDLIRLHDTIGRHVRNIYGLWEQGNPLTADAHPDDVSADIILDVWAMTGTPNSPIGRIQ